MPEENEVKKEKKVSVAADNGLIKVTFSFTVKQVMAAIFFIFTTVLGGGGKYSCYQVDANKKTKASTTDLKRLGLELASLKAELATLQEKNDALTKDYLNGKGTRSEEPELAEEIERIEYNKTEKLAAAIVEDSLERGTIYEELGTKQYPVNEIVEKKPLMGLDFSKGEITTLRERLEELDPCNPDHEKEIMEIKRRLEKLEGRKGGP